MDDPNLSRKLTNINPHKNYVRFHAFFYAQSSLTQTIAQISASSSISYQLTQNSASMLYQEKFQNLSHRTFSQHSTSALFPENNPSAGIIALQWLKKNKVSWGGFHSSRAKISKHFFLTSSILSSAWLASSTHVPLTPTSFLVIILFFFRVASYSINPLRDEPFRKSAESYQTFLKLD